VKRALPLALLVVTAVLAATASAASATGYRAEIRRTTGGVPHILASSWGDIGYGYGYAFAQDELCDLADAIVTVSAERSRYFGPEGVWGDSGQNNNLKSDLFFKRLNDEKAAQKVMAQKPPLGPLPDVKRTIAGFVAGFNAYLRKTGVKKLPDPRCRGAKWVRPITTLDMYRRYHMLTMRASQVNFLGGIVDAAPPVTTQAKRLAPSAPAPLDAGVDAVALGSNAYGIGSDLSDNGRGVVLGNPHFPWKSHERFYESHLTIPGEVDVEGASLLGVPFVNIGFTKGVAWSHTVSTARRFTPYELKLADGDPTSYVVDGKTEKMRQRTVTVKLPGGKTASHTFYETRWGPVFVQPSNFFTWSNSNAYAIADANANNARIGNTWFLMDHAQTVRQLKRAQDASQGIPWVYTVAADSKGEAYFADHSVVPNVDQKKVQDCVSSDLGKLILAQANLPVLDGSRSSCAWGTDKDALQKGTFGPKRMPFLFTKEYVENSNDSHWLPNPRKRLEGFPQIWGAERTARSLRTRLGMKMIEERIAANEKVGRGDVKSLFYNDRVYSAELARDAVVEECRAHPEQSLPDGRFVDMNEGCEVLAHWDTHAFRDSQGEILWREFWDRFTVAVPAANRFTVPFDPNDPVNTPNTIDRSNPALLQSLADAIQDMRDAGVPLNVATGEAQADPRGDELIPIHGCRSFEGCFNVIEPNPLAAPATTYNGNYKPVRTGSSFVMAVGFDRAGPDGNAILTYSQSQNPKSKYYDDQTRLYSEREWIRLPFTQKAVRKAAPKALVVSGR
jgi:acyl-homoserine-lactone acylase